MTAIKICGIRTEEHALAAAQAGADFIGLVFASSPRQVTPALAEKIVAALKKSGAGVKTVGVFVNMPAPTVRKIANACRLDWVQVSGEEPWEYCLELYHPVIKATKVSHRQSAEPVNQALAKGNKILAGRQHLFLLDTGDPEKRGGTGKTFDWNAAGTIAEKYPVIIAGGLKPENVGTAIKLIKPWGVDVSSGVETNGAKDMKKITEFINAVRDADAG
ncbi:MAG: phosphoribosylanthranilate isomerase [Dehalococcoidales bacterium]|jgi:phosphoribosylanthranilate isomerase